MVIKTVYHLQSNWKLRYPQKREVNRKRGGSFGSNLVPSTYFRYKNCLKLLLGRGCFRSFPAWEGANDLPSEKKGLPGKRGVGGN